MLAHGLGFCSLITLAQDKPPPAPGVHVWTQVALERTSREIQAQIEVLRGEKFKSSVPVKLASAADLRKYVTARIEATETPEKLSADQDVARMLGVVPPKFDVVAATMKLYESQVVGFYDPTSKSFSLMDTCPLGLAKLTMAHELTHALDDQLYDIDDQLAVIAGDTDAGLAYWAVVEGSATLIGDRWQTQNEAAIDAATIEASTAMMRGVFDNSPSWVWKPLVGTYMQGSSFLQRQDDWTSAQLGSMRPGDLARAFADPPPSSEMVLHPGKYWDDRRFDAPTKLVYEISALPEGWRVLRQDTLGELLCAVIATAPDRRGGINMTAPGALQSLKFTNAAAGGWDGDRLVLLGRDTSRLLQWTTVWDTPEDAAEFLAALNAQFDHIEAGVEKLTGDRELAFGVVIQPGGKSDEIVLTVYHGVVHTQLPELAASVGFHRPK